jgi:sugar O-acyltransferase (sialic acid O-acetyltransferase NeuD family)
MMHQKSVILIGGGGHCKSVIDVAESLGVIVFGILDLPEFVGDSVLGYPIIGCDDDISRFVPEHDFIITVGQIKDSSIRRKIATLVEKAGGRLATLVAKDAYVSKYAVLGSGTVVLHKAVVNAGARIGSSCIINTMANIEHDVQVGDFCHISTGAMINGAVAVGSDSFVGSGAIIHQGVSINSHSIVPAGSIVKRNT